MLGVALVDKPQGMSSHDAVYRARRALGIKKIGHAGTLDPNATGLLVMAVGDATRFLPYLSLEPKVYEGVAILGIETTTQDSEGEPVDERPVPPLTVEEIAVAAKGLTGTIRQIPPMFSAIQIGGQRLYKLARKGEVVERAAREVTVSELSLTSYEEPRLSFRVVCSGGTYVRTLAHDLGEILGCGAHLASLRRTRVGTFSVADAVPPERLDAARLIPLATALEPMPSVRLPQEVMQRTKQGGEFTFAGVPGDQHLALLDDDGVYAVARRIDGNMWRPERVLPAPQK